MHIPPDDVERIERQRFRNRWINVAWLVFIFSPLLFLWLPHGIASFQAMRQLLIHLVK